MPDENDRSLDPFRDGAKRPKAELVAWEIRRRIITGELQEGQNLPPEADLVKYFGVSRPTLREAIRILETQDLISISQGRRGGAVVRSPTIDQVSLQAALLFQVRRVTLREIIEAWLLIEPSVVGSLAASPPEPMMDELRECLAAESADLDAGSDAFDAAHRFHQVLTAANEETVLGSILSVLRRIIEAHFARARSSLPAVSIETSLTPPAHREHAELLACLEASDVSASEVLWRKHIEPAGKALIGEFGADELVVLAL